MGQYTIGENLKLAREYSGLSQRDLSNVSGVSPAEISRIETGIRKSIGSESIIKLCSTLKISSDWLLNLNKYTESPRKLNRKDIQVRKEGVTYTHHM